MPVLKIILMLIAAAPGGLLFIAAYISGLIYSDILYGWKLGRKA